MKKWAIGCGLLAAVGLLIALVLGGLMVGGYNSLVGLDQGVNQAWAQVQNVYQRRVDLIPNLVATVQGAAGFEKSTLVEITKARASVGQVQIDPNSAPVDPAKLRQFEQAQMSLGSALSRLLVVTERYPELRANANFRDLQAQLEGTENRITVERQKFNEAVQTYNTRVRRFPTVLYAGILGFQAKPYFSAQAGSDVAPKVQFDFGGKAPSSGATNDPGSSAPAPTAPAPALPSKPESPRTDAPREDRRPAEAPGLPSPAAN